jgi:hypothetical protein
VLGIDGHGVVLANGDGESAVLRLEHVAVVRIEDSAVAEPAPETQEQQVFTMGAGVDQSQATKPAPVSTGLAIAHPAELSA